MKGTNKTEYARHIVTTKYGYLFNATKSVVLTIIVIKTTILIPALLEQCKQETETLDWKN